MSYTPQLVAQAIMNFHQFAEVEMLLFWVCNSPDPQVVINTLIAGWRDRQKQFADASREAQFKQTGIIDTTGYDLAIAVLDEAEREIRQRFAAALKQHASESSDQPPSYRHNEVPS